MCFLALVAASCADGSSSSGGATGGEAEAGRSDTSRELGALRKRPLEAAHRRGTDCATTEPQEDPTLETAPVVRAGPVFAAGFEGPPGTRAAYDPAATEDGDWFVWKVLWVAKHAPDGPVLVRGTRVDQPGELRFSRSGGATATPELVLTRGNANHWPPGHPHPGEADWPSLLLFMGPGCYYLQADAVDGSGAFTFLAEPGYSERESGSLHDESGPR